MADYGLFKVPSEFNKPHFVPKGPIIYDVRTGRVAGHMEKIMHFPRSALETVGLLGSISSLVNLGVSTATFTYMRSAFKRAEQALSNVAHSLDEVDQKIGRLQRTVDAVQAGVEQTIHGLTRLGSTIEENRHIEVFAEIGAVLDVLTYADVLPEKEAQQMVLSNLVPIRKALRVYNAFVSRAAQGARSEELVEILHLEYLALMLEVRTAIILGRIGQAQDDALAFKKRVEEIASKLAFEWRPQVLKILAVSHEPYALAHPFARLNGESAEQLMKLVHEVTHAPSWNEVNDEIRRRWKFIDDLPDSIGSNKAIALRTFCVDVPMEAKWALKRYPAAKNIEKFGDFGGFHIIPIKIPRHHGVMLRKGDEISITLPSEELFPMPCDGIFLGCAGNELYCIEVNTSSLSAASELDIPPVDRLDRILSIAIGVASEVTLIKENPASLEFINHVLAEPFIDDFVLSPVTIS